MNLLPWHHATWNALGARLAAKSVPHAILLVGPKGIGKQQLATAFAKSLLCRQLGADGHSCGSCRCCILLAAGSHPDFHLCRPIEDSKQVRIDQVRELARKSALTSTMGDYQVFLVDPADAMNTNAANAFLKTLEEPSASSIIVLLAERPGNLPATIISRCQQFQIQVPANEVGIEWLSTVGDWPQEQCREALAAAGGAPLLAQSILAEEHADKLTQAVEVLVAAGEGRADPVSLAAQWQDEWLGARLDWWRRWLRELAWIQAQGSDGSDSGAPRRLQRMMANVDLQSLVRYLERLNRARGLLESPIRQDLLVEDLLISWRKLARNGG
jgi:DNA polymerase-3 subunit delta'